MGLKEISGGSESSIRALCNHGYDIERHNIVAERVARFLCRLPDRIMMGALTVGQEPAKLEL